MDPQIGFRPYASIQPELGDAFMVELDDAIERICDAPRRWPRYLHGTRQFILTRFPYVVVHRATSERIDVIAVAHVRQKPGYWAERLWE